MQTTEHGETAIKEETKDKKSRKRMKAIYSQIREQMEFYFSDSNLNRDRFMKQQLAESKDGYIGLEIFLKFNKMKTLTSDTRTIAIALKNSQLLEVSKDSQRVKRTKPVSSAKDIDDRTVYVECLPHSVDHDWIKKVFSGCGRVLYVSIPRYKSTGDPKGFAFIEFDSKEAANKACEDLNNPPAEANEKPGKFPRTSKQLTHLQKTLGYKEEEILEPDKNVPESPTKSSKKKRKRQRTTSECSNEGGHTETTSKQRKLDLNESDQNKDSLPVTDTANQSSNIVRNDESDEKELMRKKNKKRKKSKGEGQVSITESETSDHPSVDDSDKETRKRKSCDREHDDSEPPKKLSKDIQVCDNKENSETAANISDVKNGAEVTGGSKDKKKKKKRNHKSKHKDKDIPELRVISKHDWLGLRAEYIKLQKESMNRLKRTLNKMKEEQKITEKEEDKPEHSEETKPDGGKKSHSRPKIEFTPNVIVSITSGMSMYRKEIKEDLGTDYQVAYIDLKEGDKNGYIRMKDSESAKKLAEASSGSYFFKLLEGQEEKDYWNKLESDRDSKFSTKQNKKKRGSQKLIEKAQKISKENISRTHVKFDD